MAKFALIVASLFVACGRSECQDYATVWCQKLATCGFSTGGATLEQAMKDCEDAANKSAAATHMTDAQCKTARENVAPMTCIQFRALVAAITK